MIDHDCGGASVWYAPRFSRGDARGEVIESKIQDFVDSGILDENSVNPLKVKLDAAIGFIDKGKMFQASKNLGDFISEVIALINSGRLSVEDGEYLISLAQGIIDVLLTL